MEVLIIEMVERFGYIGIILLIALENIFPPIPSEVILTFGGFLTTYTKLNVWGVILSATIGSVAGAIVLYIVGRCLTGERLMQLVDGKLGKRLPFNRDDVEYTLEWFAKKGNKAVFFCRCIPILRSLISIPAGMAKMAMGSFMLMTVMGTVIWNVVLVHLGAFAGASWGIITEYMGTYKNWTLLVLGIALFAGIMWFIRKQRKKKILKV